MSHTKRLLRIPLLTSLICLGAWGSVMAEPQITRGSIIASTCFTCHGTDGEAKGTMPSLNGFSAERIERVMNEFRAGTRAATVMSRHASGYTDEEIRDLAQYIGQLQ